MIEQLQKVDEKNNKEKKKKKIIIIISIVLIFLIVGGIIAYFYFQPKNVVKKKKKEVKTLKIVDLNSKERPIAVMIDNNLNDNVSANGHVGLQNAYITYECIVEGGLTRIMAIFKDKKVDLLGPVRSARHYYLDYALENDAIYAHYGWSTYAESDINTLGVDNLNGMTNGEAAYFRDTTIASPHNVFTSTEKLYETARANNYSTTSEDWLLLNYSVDDVTFKAPKKSDDSSVEPIDDRIVANKITIPYSNSQVRSYQYDTEKKVYLRFMNSIAHTDRESKEQYNYKNIIIQKVENSSLDSYGRQDLTTTGSGEGYFVTNGYAKKIKWTKPSRSGKIKYTYEDGSKVKVNDGNTFIQVEPAALDTTFE